MSNLSIKRVQVGNSTAGNNFVIRQPDTADGTLRISNGNIGTTTDLITVTAAGNFTINANIASTSTTTGSLIVTGGQGVSGNIYAGGMQNTPIGNITPSTGAFTSFTATTIVETSSIAFKENVNTIDNALDSIMQLVGVTYDRKDNKEHEAGLIAEDVNKVLPNLVSKDANGDPHGIKYSKLTAYLVEAVKSLKQEIDQLKGNKQ
jgi:hypothetical protein